MEESTPVKVCIYKDCQYPFYEIHRIIKFDTGCSGEMLTFIPDFRVKWIRGVMNEYKEVQKYLEDLYEHTEKN